MLKEKKQAIEWKKKYGDTNFKPKLIFSKQNTKDSLLFSLGFYVMIMASEILFIFTCFSARWGYSYPTQIDILILLWVSYTLCIFARIFCC